MDYPNLIGLTVAEVESIQNELSNKSALLIEETNSDQKKGRSIIEARVIRQQEQGRIIKITVSYF